MSSARASPIDFLLPLLSSSSVLSIHYVKN
jgi:hypothetical protein